jgi:hypothetical protein
MPDLDLSKLGHLLEGVVEQDPMTDRYRIRIVDPEGNPTSVDLQELLAQYKGKEVRLTLASLENLAKLAELVESQGGGGRVQAIGPGFRS